MSGPVRIRVENLGKLYPGGRTWGIRGVSFEVPEGGALAVVGENGSGKSTLLDLLLGATRPTTGEVEVRGPVAALLELGAGLFLELTGRRNAIQMGLLAGLRLGEARRLAETVGAFSELGEHFDRPLRTYSAGMTMRLGFAIASCSEAPVTLVDEVLAVGDGYFQRKCIDRLREMRRRGTTLVVASHDLHALRALSDQALWLREGGVAALGPSDEVIGRYEEHLRLRTAAADVAPGRRGTGEIVIRAVRLADAGGRETAEIPFGGTLRVEVTWETTRPVTSPVMGVALFREDGVYCYGPNSRFDGGGPGETYDGRYRLLAEFPGLPLLPGRYEVSVAFYDADHVYAYAWDHRLYPFRITAGPPDHGVVALRHRFVVERADR